MKFTKTMARRILRFIKKYPDNYNFYQVNMRNSRGRELETHEIPEWDDTTVPPKNCRYDEVSLFLAFTPKNKRSGWLTALEEMEDKIGIGVGPDLTIDALRRYAK